ncbi:MAG: MerR family transcriptional regulator [Nitrospirota bacterium]
MRIRDAAEALGVSVATLKRFLILQAPQYLSRKTPGGYYRFSKEDIKTIDRLMRGIGERRNPIYNFHKFRRGW